MRSDDTADEPAPQVRRRELFGIGSKPAPHRKRVRRLLLGAVAALLLFWVLAVLGLQRLILFPSYAVRSTPGAGDDLADLDRLWIDTDEGRVEGWFLPGRGVSEERPGPIVLFAHGNAELIEQWPDMLQPYRDMGVSLLLPEYRGYGRSAGSPSEKAITDDLERFLTEVLRRPEVDPSRVIFHGRSLGGGAVCALARRRRPAALVLQSTFTSVADVARRWLVPRFMVRDRFDNLATLGGLDVPVLLVHGRRDRLIPVAHAETLRSAAPQARLVLYDADHNDCPPDWTVFWTDVRGFLVDARIL